MLASFSWFAHAPEALGGGAKEAEPAGGALGADEGGQVRGFEARPREPRGCRLGLHEPLKSPKSVGDHSESIAVFLSFMDTVPGTKAHFQTLFLSRLKYIWHKIYHLMF